MIGFVAGHRMYRPTVERFVKGEPAALLLVEFAGVTATTTCAASSSSSS